MKLHEFFKEDGSNWCQGSFAQNSRGETISCSSPHAKKFCVLGAAIRLNISNHDKISEITAKLNRKISEITIKTDSGERDITGWQDTPGRTVKEVIEVCRALDV